MKKSQGRNKRLLAVLLAATIIVVTVGGLVLYNGYLLYYGGTRPVELTKTQRYLYGEGGFGKAPDDYVKGEEYYRDGLITEWYNDTTDKRLLAYMAYRRACLTYATTQGKSWRLYGEGAVQSGVGFAEASGTLIASGVRYEKRRGASMASDTALQNVSMLSSITGEAGIIMDMARSVVEYGEQRLWTQDYEYYRKHDRGSFSLDEQYDIASARFTNSAQCYGAEEYRAMRKEQGYVYREYPAEWGDEYGLTSPEKTDHIINMQSIAEDGVTVTPMEQDGRRYYEISFDVDTVTVLDGGTTATYYFEEYMLNTLNLKEGLLRIGVKYDSLRVTLQVWDCGYLRSWQTDERWVVTATLGAIAVTAQTQIKSYEFYSYAPDDNRFDSLAAEITQA